MSRKVLVIGSGGREHALCWKLAQSEQVSHIFCAPGNAGTATEAKTQNVDITTNNFPQLIAFVQENQIDLTVVGPDNALADGIVDAFQAQGLKIFGPNQASARLESSKVFAKQFMQQAQLPTARFAVFHTALEALAFCEAHDWARIIKVDGLALGKGVYVCDSVEECREALHDIFEANRFGTAGAQVVIEERLNGAEFSLMTLFDGKTLVPFTSSQDYKRRFAGNHGPNTGGMGAYSPVPDYAQYESAVLETIIKPLETALMNADFTYNGLLYIGVMIHDGRPYILEFNARFGDPETQVLLPRLENDFYELLSVCVVGELNKHPLKWSDNSCVGVVLCAETYPQQGSKGEPITLDALPPQTMIFHAGTAIDEAGTLVTQGGRIFNVVGWDQTLPQATQKAYQAVDAIYFAGKAFRPDIARQDIKDLATCP